MEGTSHTHLGNLVRFFTATLFTVKIDFAFGGSINTGNHIEGSSLACTVRTDEANQLAFVNVHGKVGNCTQTTKDHGNVIYFQQFCH